MKKLLQIPASIFLLSLSFVGFSDDAVKNTTHSFTKGVDSNLQKLSTELSQEEKALAKEWSLTETDWIKYKRIMKGPRGIWSPGLDPITSLGVSEKNSVERKRYAELWIEVETKRVELEIAFEIDRREAGKKLNGDKLAINNQQWKEDWSEKKNAVRKIVAFFVVSTCLEECKIMFKELTNSIGNNSRLDVYFGDATTSENIGKWASFMDISPERVKAREITLNFDEGTSRKYSVDLSTLPQVRVIDVETGTTTKTF